MKKALLALALVALFCDFAAAQVTRYWDIDGVTAGAGGGTTPSGTWDAATTNWNATAAGTGAATTWSNNGNGRFAAGTTATGSYTVTVSGTINVNQIGLEDGSAVNGPTFTGGVLNFTHTAGSTSILTGVVAGVSTSATISSQITGTGGFRIARNSGTGNIITINNPANSWSGVAHVGLDNTLRLGASEVIPDGNIAQIDTGGTLNLNGFNETVAAISSTGSINLNGATLTLNAPAGESFGGVISGAAAGSHLVKNGGGTQTLTAVNTYVGNTTLNAGAVNIDGDATLGNGAGTLFLAGGKLNTTVDRSNTANPVANPINMSANTEITTSSTASSLNLNFTSTTIVGTAGTLTFRNDGADAASDLFDPRFSGSAFNFTRPIVIDNGAVGATRLSSFNTVGTTQTFSGDVSGNGSYRRSATSPDTGGDTILSGNNSYSGGTANNGGGIGFGSNTAIGTGTLTTGSNNAALFASGGARTISNAVTLNSDVTFKGSNQLEMAGGVNLGAVNRTLTVTNTADTTLSGVVGDGGSGTGALSKAGVGKLILAGANTYGGGTVVNAGTLLVNNTTGSGTGSGNVGVTGGTLGGTGTISGSVTVSGTGTLAPGASVESMGMGAVFLLAGATFKYEIDSTAVTADLLDSSGSLSIDTTGAGVALTLLDWGGDVKIANGTKFTMIAYDGTWNGGTFVGAPNLGVVTIGLNNQFQIRYADTTAGGNFAGETMDNARFVTLTSVPELSSFVSVGLGGLFAIGAVWLGRRFGFNALQV